MDTNHNVIAQELIEQNFNRKHIDVKLKEAIEANPKTMKQLEQGVLLVEKLLSGTYYKSKQHRYDQMTELELHDVVMDIFIGVCYCQIPELFTSVTAQMSARLQFSDRVDAIATVAEMMAVLCETDAFHIDKETPQSSLMVVSAIELPDELLEWVNHSQYLPPMVCEPLELTHNYSSGYLTHNDSLVCGKGSPHHDGDLCLDVLNTMNRVKLKLNLDFLCKVEEQPTFEIENQDQKDGWSKFKEDSYYMYSLMAKQGNRFHLTHKVDKRGRVYACGYHINTGGAPFKKAMVEFANEELVTGVP